MSDSSLAIFKGKNIRRILHKNEWRISVIIEPVLLFADRISKMLYGLNQSLQQSKAKQGTPSTEYA